MRPGANYGPNYIVKIKLKWKHHGHLQWIAANMKAIGPIPPVTFGLSKKNVQTIGTNYKICSVTKNHILYHIVQVWVVWTCFNLCVFYLGVHTCPGPCPYFICSYWTHSCSVWLQALSQNWMASESPRWKKGQNHRAFHRKKPTMWPDCCRCLWSFEANLSLKCDSDTSDLRQGQIWGSNGSKNWSFCVSHGCDQGVQTQHRWTGNPLRINGRRRSREWSSARDAKNISGMCHNWNIPKTSRKSPGLDKH